LDKCSGKRGKLCGYEDTSITDRTGRKLPVTYDCMHCTNIIWNSVPVSLFKKAKKIKSMADKISMLYRFDFTTETSTEVMDILNAYSGIFYGSEKDKNEAEKVLASMDYTTGHFERSAD
jgi:putative protease